MESNRNVLRRCDGMYLGRFLSDVAFKGRVGRSCRALNRLLLITCFIALPTVGSILEENRRGRCR